MQKRGLQRVVVFLGTLSFCCGAMTAETWYVDQSVTLPGKGTSWKTAFKTIQEGIDAAEGRDTVLVAEGTYVETIHFKGKNIILRSTEPLNSKVVQNTIIDGKGTGSVVTFSGSEDKGCVLSGFTIRNGKAKFGGGIAGHGALAAIRNSAIMGNSATEDGGGLHECNGTIQNNTISGNSAERQGGGLAYCDGIIQSNTIHGNSSGFNGGALYRCDGSIRNNSVRDNHADQHGGGLYGCPGIIQENPISGNSAGSQGGGLAFCDGTIENNTISTNQAVSNGGGLYLCDGTIQNNAISGNFAQLRGGGLYGCNGTIRNNVITGNETHGGPTLGTGGGLYNCDGPIENNEITANSTEGVGGGLAHCDGTIQNNDITENSADVLGGGLVFCHGAIQNNTITRNSTDGSGGGLAWCDATIQNNTIAGNSAEGSGGGVAECNVTIRNNTITGNRASSRGGGLSSCQGTIQNCIIWGNVAEDGGNQLYNSSVPTYSCIQGWDGGEGNISSDPRFVDIDGPDNDSQTYEDNDYRLSAGSPCIDTGDNTGLNPPGFDLDGNLRIAYGEHSVTVDMGAYEYNSGTIEIRRVHPLGSSGVRLTWRSQPNDTYTVWSRPALPTGTWIEEGTVLSQGAVTPWTDIAAIEQMKFYRVEMK